MFSLTIVFGAASPVLWTLLYETEDRANAAYEKCLVAKAPQGFAIGGGHVPHTIVTLEDDYSQRVSIDAENIHGFMIEDMDRSQLGQIAKALHDRRAQVKFEALVNAEPGLRQPQRQPSMPILQPMGNGFRPVS